jgi:hypothetical protein
MSLTNCRCAKDGLRLEMTVQPAKVSFVCLVITFQTCPLFSIRLRLQSKLIQESLAKPVAIVRWIEAAAAIELARRRGLPIARLALVAASPIRAVGGGVRAPRRHERQDGLPPFHAPLGGLQPWAASGQRLKTATEEKDGRIGGPSSTLQLAGPLAIPLRQAEMRIRDKTSVDKASRTIYSSLTIDDHSLDRFGRA